MKTVGFLLVFCGLAYISTAQDYKYPVVTSLTVATIDSTVSQRIGIRWYNALAYELRRSKKLASKYATEEMKFPSANDWIDAFGYLRLASAGDYEKVEDMLKAYNNDGSEGYNPVGYILHIMVFPSTGETADVSMLIRPIWLHTDNPETDNAINVLTSSIRPISNMWYTNHKAEDVAASIAKILDGVLK